ncbi:Fic family protein [Actinomyces slackii]|uniref:protein adenylyltransferase n=1 Tax=Actinomyces slackii TaxID=52774 RepID=A0A3S4STL7_9ACTO|nr:Fic family protein [Actinomyces slackii]VEG74750.1 Probable adenosine monophosphate-protein transferase fic [Actinomyces slackii]
MPSSTQRQRWLAYLYPDTVVTHPDGTIDGTLRNLLDEHDDNRLTAAEYTLTFNRATELAHNPDLIAPTLDDAEVRAVHHHLFQDIYPWAGQYRTVNMGKEASLFATAPDGITRALAAMTRHNIRVPWARLDRDDTITCTAWTIALLNYAHPFREGNGRTTKAFIDRILIPTRYQVNWASIDPDTWNRASQDAMPQPGTTRPRPQVLAVVLTHALQHRPTTVADAALERARHIYQMLQPPSQATTQTPSSTSQSTPPPAPEPHQTRYQRPRL